MSEKNKDIVRRYYEELWNPWDLDAAYRLISPEMEFLGSLGITVRGIEGFQGYMSTVRSAFPDFYNQVDDLVAEDDKVVARLTYTGTHQGEMLGLKPTGKAITYSGIAVFRISGETIVEGWVMGDRWGVIPAANTTVTCCSPTVTDRLPGQEVPRTTSRADQPGRLDLRACE